jgi:hypothetical protein
MMPKKKEQGPTPLGLTSVNIAITLILNGIEVEEAKQVAREFGYTYGNRTLGDAEDEVLAWARDHRPVKET